MFGVLAIAGLLLILPSGEVVDSIGTLTSIDQRRQTLIT